MIICETGNSVIDGHWDCIGDHSDGARVETNTSNSSNTPSIKPNPKDNKTITQHFSSSTDVFKDAFHNYNAHQTNNNNIIPSPESQMSFHSMDAHPTEPTKILGDQTIKFFFQCKFTRGSGKINIEDLYSTYREATVKYREVYTRVFYVVLTNCELGELALSFIEEIIKKNRGMKHFIFYFNPFITKTCKHSQI